MITLSRCKEEGTSRRRGSEAIELRTTSHSPPRWAATDHFVMAKLASIVNYSKQYSSQIDVPVPSSLELRQFSVIKRVSEHLQRECLDALEDSTLKDLESFDADNLVTFRTMTRVKPVKHLHCPEIVRSKLTQRLLLNNWIQKYSTPMEQCPE